MARVSEYAPHLNSVPNGLVFCNINDFLVDLLSFFVWVPS